MADSEQWRRALALDVLAGPHGPRAISGALMDDVAAIERIERRRDDTP